MSPHTKHHLMMFRIRGRRLRRSLRVTLPAIKRGLRALEKARELAKQLDQTS